MTLPRETKKRDNVYLASGSYVCHDPRSPNGRHLWREQSGVEPGDEESTWECRWCGATKMLPRSLPELTYNDLSVMKAAAVDAGYSSRTGLWSQVGIR